MSDGSSAEWKKGVFQRILAAYEAKNANALAVVLNEKFGIVRQTVYDWRRGKSKPTQELLEKISADRGKPVGYFLKGYDTSFSASNQEPGHSAITEIAAIRKETLLSYAAAELELLRSRIGDEAVHEFLIEQMNEYTMRMKSASNKPTLKERQA